MSTCIIVLDQRSCFESIKDRRSRVSGMEKMEIGGGSGRWGTDAMTRHGAAAGVLDLNVGADSEVVDHLLLSNE